MVLVAYILLSEILSVPAFVINIDSLVEYSPANILALDPSFKSNINPDWVSILLPASDEVIVNLPLFSNNFGLFCAILNPFISNVISLVDGITIVGVLSIVVNSLNCNNVSPTSAASIPSWIVKYSSFVLVFFTIGNLSKYLEYDSSWLSLWIISYPSSISFILPKIGVSPVIIPS